MSLTGYKTMNFDNEGLSVFYLDPSFACSKLEENEYLGVCDESGSIVDKYRKVNGKLTPIKYHKIENQFSGIVRPRNLEQEFAFDLMQDRHTTVKLLTGRWGTGKTMILAIHAIEALLRGEFQKIVYVRNNIEVKDTTPLGALPGDAFQKTLWTAGPLIDHVGGEDGLMNFVNAGQIEIAHLGYLRGRDIRNSLIMVSEAENLTKEHLQLLLGRVGEGSNLWLDADVRQRDKIAFEKSRGIETLIERLYGNELFGYVHLVKGERSKTAELANLLDGE